MSMDGHKITGVEPGSIAEELELEKDDVLLRINGTEIVDVLDYIEWMGNESLELLIRKADGEEWEIQLEKEPGEDLGLKFEHDLMDQERTCRNKCIFCFVDQLPKGMRDSLYYKDDDWRLSFLVGNYITLTNLSDCDVDRIVEKHISPLFVSVHTTNPELRRKMLNNRFAGDVLGYLKTMADAGIQLHTQIVLCPGWNDGAELDRTLSDLWELRGSVQSVAVVPVGLTGHREKLAAVRPFDAGQAARLIDQVKRWQAVFRPQWDRGFVYAADEFYVLAGREFPSLEYYDEFPQVENGVGLTLQFRNEFDEALADRTDQKRNEANSNRAGKDASGNSTGKSLRQTIVTGRSAYQIIKDMADRVNDEFHTDIQVLGVTNRFFGNSVTVAGLVTGSDIMTDIEGKDLGERLLIPEVMLRKGQDVFLDDVSVSQLAEHAGVPVSAVPVRGDAFLDALLNGKDLEVMKCQNPS
jgi:putative radical SAM enzyme (TIGR03279 family)